MKNTGRFFRLFFVGFIGVVVLMMTINFPEEVIAQSKFTNLQIRLMAIFQLAIMLSIAVLVGNLTSKRTGFVSWIGGANTEGTPKVLWAVLCSIVAFSVGVFFVGIECWLVGNSLEFRQFYTSQGEALSNLTPPVFTRILYGGITEEVLIRWGVMVFSRGSQ